MIYHQKCTGFANLGSVDWWAIDSDTLTIARCTAEKGPRFRLEILRPPTRPPVVSSFAIPPDTGEGAIAILMDCRKHFKTLSSCPASLSLVEPKSVDIAEYMLVGQVGEIPDGILHTRDPIFIGKYTPEAPHRDPRKSLIAYSSSRWLPTEGWEYWCTDARQEIERLLDEYIHAIQMAALVPSRFGEKNKLAR